MAGRPRLAVLGSLNTDISVAVPRLAAPGETVLGSDAVIAPGGKGANQAVAAARLGATVLMAGCTGARDSGAGDSGAGDPVADDFGAALTAALAAEGVDVSAVRAVAGYATGMALITIDAAGENVITVAPGANGQAGATEVDAALAGPCDLLIISAEIPLATVGMALAAARGAGTASLLNLAPASAGATGLLAEGVGWLVVNEPEAATVLGRPVTGLAAAQAAAADLRGLGARNVVVTAGSEGAAVASGGAAQAVSGLRVRSVDAVGAGDAFVAALAVTLAAGIPAIEAVHAACAAGAAATTRRGTQAALPRPADILAATGVRWPLPSG
jgi:ribokinase